MKQIQFTKGCPNGCQFCYEPKKIEQLHPDVMSISEGEEVQILDMNFLANPDHYRILHTLIEAKYEFICGLDYRLMTPIIARLLKEKGFIKVRWAWDYHLIKLFSGK